jgi:Flp pilus assembly protein TadG
MTAMDQATAMRENGLALPLPYGRGSVGGCRDDGGCRDEASRCRDASSDCRDARAFRNRRRGATLIEFTLLGIPAIFLCTSIVACSIGMWQFFMLNYAVAETARYASMHGATCVHSASNPNDCSIMQTDVATYFENAAIALAPASTTLKLTDGSGVTTCSPVTSCSSAAMFPSAGNNAVGSNITIQGSYTLLNPIFMFWPSGGSVAAHNVNVSSSSTQAILF